MSDVDINADADNLLGHTGWLRRLAFELLRDQDGVDDVVQETFAKALRTEWQSIQNLRGWLSSILIRVVRRSVAVRKRAERDRANPILQHLPSPLEVAETLEMQRIILTMLHGLDPLYRDVLVMRYIHECAPSQIAQIQGVPVDTVYTRLKRGLATIRSELDRKFRTRERWQAPLIAVVQGNTRHGPGSGPMAHQALAHVTGIVARQRSPLGFPLFLTALAVVAACALVFMHTSGNTHSINHRPSESAGPIEATTAKPETTAVSFPAESNPLVPETAQPGVTIIGPRTSSAAQSDSDIVWKPWAIREQALRQLQIFADRSPDVVELMGLLKMIADSAPTSAAECYQQDGLRWHDLVLDEQGVVVSFGLAEQERGIRLRFSPSIALPEPFDPRNSIIDARVVELDHDHAEVRGTIAYSIIPGKGSILKERFCGSDLTLGHSFVLNQGRLMLMRHNAHIREASGVIVVDNSFATKANAFEVRTDASPEEAEGLLRAIQHSHCWN